MAETVTGESEKITKLLMTTINKIEKYKKT